MPGPPTEVQRVTSVLLSTWHLLKDCLKDSPESGKEGTVLLVHTDGSKALGWLGDLGSL